jgi:2-hydroxy-3-keto-5-methylthiopentenyl-1-phosphate phosphatase
MLESIIKGINQSIDVTNIGKLSSKIQNFLTSYKNNKKNIALVTDFDFTISKKYNYQKNLSLGSSYRFYDESLIGGNQQKVLEIQNELCNKYMKYETDASIDIKIREKKVEEFYDKSLDVYINPNFTRDSIGKMLEKLKEKFELRKYTKELFELLMKLEIPIIIVSGGIQEVIIDLLKNIMPDFELYCKQKKILIISNTLYFEEGKGCVGHSKDVIYAFNKSSFVKNSIEKNFPEIKNIFIMGDHLNDYDSVRDLNMTQDNIIGLGFVNIKPELIGDETKKEEIQKNIDDYKKVYDINLIGDTDFLFMIKLLELFEDQSTKI